MNWTETTRRQYARRTARYASDMTDRDPSSHFAHAPSPWTPRIPDLREIMNTLLDVTTTSFQWRMLPRNFRSCPTVQPHFHEWLATGLWMFENEKHSDKAKAFKVLPRR